MLISKSLTMMISNRELLREYKVWKEKLLKGEIDQIEVPQKNGKVLKITVEKDKTPFEKLCEMVEKKPLPLIKRPKFDLFDHI